MTEVTQQRLVDLMLGLIQALPRFVTRSWTRNYPVQASPGRVLTVLTSISLMVNGIQGARVRITVSDTAKMRQREVMGQR